MGNSSEINAYADGERVVITTGMMRFADDLELAVVVGHEIAHNAMDHITAMRSNALWGALAGAVLDGLMGAGGADGGGGLTQLGADAGASRFSQDFEREADYVGLYVLARAGVELSRAPEFWRHMAIANPGSIGLATSHPTSAERFVRLEQALDGDRSRAGSEKRRDGAASAAGDEARADGDELVPDQGMERDARHGPVRLAVDDINEFFVYLAYFPAVMFWMLDAYFLRQERLFRRLYDDVRGRDGIDFSRRVSRKMSTSGRWPFTLRLFHGTLVGAVA